MVVALPALLSLFMILSATLIVAFAFPGLLVPREMNEACFKQSVGLSTLLMTGLAFVGNLGAALFISHHLKSFILKIDHTIRHEPLLESSFEASSEIGALGIMLDQASITISKFVNDSYIIDNLPEAVIMVDFNGTIIRLNSNAAKLLKVGPEECTERNLRDFIPATPMSRSFYSLIDEALQGVAVHLRSVNFSTRENESRLYWVSVHPVWREQNLPTEVSISIKDQASITAVRNQIQKVERLAAIGSMASTIAHEIRNPLGAIRTFTELIQEGLFEGDPSTGYIKEILKQIERLDRMVEDTLAFSRAPVTTVKDVDLSELLSRTVALARYRFPGRAMAIDEDYKPELPTIKGDPEKLSQAFLNILINSFEACGEKGWIVISAGLAGDYNENGNTVCISIADNGTGISPEDTNRLFEPFFTTKSSGTGLGLATAHNILSTHGGLIEVDSKPGKGTTFQVLLPEKHHFCELQSDDRWSYASHA